MWEEYLMRDNKRILVAVDGSEASLRTVAYVADMVGGRSGFHVGLLHLELTPRMLEWGGSENPEIEDRTESDRAEAYREMEEERLARGKPLLQRLQVMVADKGIDVMGLFVQLQEPLDRKNVTRAILNAAKEHNAGTVVVGRNECSNWKRLFHHYVGEELVREGEGITIWVVE
jgi:nucleotide-binding universal stress UspA family protein